MTPRSLFWTVAKMSAFVTLLLCKDSIFEILVQVLYLFRHSNQDIAIYFLHLQNIADLESFLSVENWSFGYKINQENSIYLKRSIETPTRDYEIVKKQIIFIGQTSYNESINEKNKICSFFSFIHFSSSNENTLTFLAICTLNLSVLISFGYLSVKFCCCFF